MVRVEVKRVYDEKRGCGWRRPGTYLVSADNCVSGDNSTSVDGDSGGFGIDGEAAGLILLDPPVAVDAATVPKRGYCYVDGEAILAHAGADEALETPKICRDIAEARAFSWRTFGLEYPDRVGQGICAGLERFDQVINAVTGVAWWDRSRFRAAADAAYRMVGRRRAVEGDVRLVGLISTSMAMQRAGRDESPELLLSNGLARAAAGLAAAWQMVDLARRLGFTEIVQQAVTAMTATTAAADAAYSLRYRPRDYAVAPDILDWVGQRHYPTTASFIDEARRLGISRRMPGIPKAVVTQHSRAFLAHASVPFPNGVSRPAVFGYYRVAQTQQVMRPGDVVPPWLAAYRVQPVRVERRLSMRELEAVPA